MRIQETIALVFLPMKDNTVWIRAPVVVIPRPERRKGQPNATRLTPNRDYIERLALDSFKDCGIRRGLQIKLSRAGKVPLKSTQR
jgi:hypothetical protein